MSRKIPWAFYFITDSNLTRQGFLKDSEDAIRGGARVIQYREKNKSFKEMFAEASALFALCKIAGVDLIINDSPELARTVGASGANFGQGDGPLSEARKTLTDGIIGVSCGTVAEVKNAELSGADYIAASPVFFTGTKKDIGHPIGLDGLARLRAATDLHVVAIGGVNLANVRSVVLAGADSVCAISATVGTPDIAASIRKFEARIISARKETGR
jgi:thiamine-phosphate pyrophosphorylase